MSLLNSHTAWILPLIRQESVILKFYRGSYLIRKFSNNLLCHYVGHFILYIIRGIIPTSTVSFLAIVRIQHHPQLSGYSTENKLEFKPSPDPLNGSPCLDRNFIFDKSFNRAGQLFVLSSMLFLSSMLPTSSHSFGIITHSSAALWHSDCWCLSNLFGAPFQFL